MGSPRADGPRGRHVLIAAKVGSGVHVGLSVRSLRRRAVAEYESIRRTRLSLRASFRLGRVLPTFNSIACNGPSHTFSHSPDCLLVLRVDGNSASRDRIVEVAASGTRPPRIRKV